MIATHAHSTDAPAQGPMPQQAEVALVLSMLHVSKLDLERIRTHGWPLPYSVTEHQIHLTLPSLGRKDEQRDAFIFRLYVLGFTKSFADLIDWACKADRQVLLLDDSVEPSDRLLIFVG